MKVGITEVAGRARVTREAVAPGAGRDVPVGELLFGPELVVRAGTAPSRTEWCG
ncbi:hypothetical protein ACIQVL_38735 [Streptomyces sp. NPDC090499]|uniref:hypothetical protein n=1 Tax=unclassified Streptomyces TaxID=2593676 RepID=UPI0037FF0FE3